MFNAASRLLSFSLKLLFGLFAAIFTISLLVAALIVAALGLLASLISGRKPAPSAVFGRFQRFSRQGMWPGGFTREDSAKTRPASGDVMDVEVREISRDKRQP